MDEAKKRQYWERVQRARASNRRSDFDDLKKVEVVDPTDDETQTSRVGLEEPLDPQEVDFLDEDGEEYTEEQFASVNGALKNLL